MVAATVLAAPAWAANCPGNPNALGTSRTLVVDPMEHPRIGTMQYAETLPLRDHEVVLTFDDGPLPPHSNQVLKILASECVKATFFIIGRMAHQFPEGVRRVRAAGHTIGTHSENHPLHFNKMTPERIRQEIDLGIAHTAEALGDPSAGGSAIPLLPGGIGVVEAVLVPALVQAGMSTADAFLAVILYRIVSYVLVSAIGWVVIAIRYRAEIKSRDDIQHEMAREEDDLGAGPESA